MESSKYYILCVCVCVCVPVALVIQDVMRMCRIILSSVACLSLPYFSTMSHNGHNFVENVIDNKMRVWISSTTFV